MDAKNIEAVYPLSPLQQGIFFHSTLQSGADQYFGQVTMTLEGALDPTAFHQTWQKIVARHSVLRSLFTTNRQGKPVQIVLKSVELPIESIDLRTVPENLQETEINQILKADRERPMDFNHAPLMRLTVVRLTEEKYRFIWSEHHLLVDGWSVSLILNEMLAIYEGLQQGIDVELPSPPPYRDYVKWLGKQDARAAESHWRTVFHGFDSPTVLPFAKKAAANDGAQPAEDNGVQETEISAALIEKLRRVGIAERLTLNTIFQGAWSILLHKYSGQDDIVYGATVSGRPPELTGVEQMVGPFINTLPARVHLDSEKPVNALLKAIQEQQIESRQYEYSHLVDVHGWSGLSRNVPLFESIFVVENYPARKSSAGTQVRLALSGLSATEQSNFPLAFVVGLAKIAKLKVLYSRSKFSDEMMQDLLRHFITVLEQIAENPARLVGSVGLASEAECRLILEEWNNTGSEYPADKSVVDLFAEQVALHPGKVAVSANGTTLTYAELDRQSSQLARYLISKGAGSEQLVAICLDRSPAMIVALLGILKTGAAYLPMDGGWPASRLEFLLKDAGTNLVICEKQYEAQFQNSGCNLVVLDDDQAVIVAQSPDPLIENVDSDQLAYVIYTSGSTGKPKGVSVTHRSIVRLVKNTNYLQFGTDEVFLQFAPLFFDASTLEIWGSLLNGSHLVVFPAHLPSLDELADTIEQSGITTLWLTAGLFHRMVESHTHKLSGLHQLVAGGDVLAPASVDRVLQELPHVRLVNGYGPTESTTFTCCHTVQSRENESIPIGTPISNTQVYVLDKDLQLLPPGIPGELYIGGDGLARGYLSHPALTAEKFIPHPFATTPGERLYRTGDRVRYLAGGVVEFLGRVDYQVKIRGFRIELEEIEAALNRYPGVQESAVLIVDTPAGEKQLAAFVVAASQRSLSTDDLRGFLKSQLPDYMVPTALSVRAELPLTPNGKVDRKALREEAGQTRVEAEEYKTLLSPVEELLTARWQELLKLPRVGLHDDFFELGGHSLLAMQIISLTRDMFQVQIPLKSFFETPTIAGLSKAVEHSIRVGNDLKSKIQPVPRGERLPLSLAQERLWFLDKLEPGSSAYNIPLALRLRGSLNLDALEISLNALIERHESLRTIFPENDGIPFQAISKHGNCDFKVIDLRKQSSAQREAETQRLVNIESHCPFNLVSGPLMRAVVILLAAEEQVLLLTMHHIISDGHSMKVLLDELKRIYAAQVSGSPFPLEAAPLQYADYAAWQRAVLNGEGRERLLAYWKSQLQDAPEEIHLQSARPRPEKRSARGALFSWTLPGSLAETVKSVSSRQGVTKFMTLLAAFSCVLRHRASSDDLMVGADVAGRSDSNVQCTVGFFVNQLPLRVKCPSAQTFRGLLAEIRQTTLGAYAHQEIPFQMLLDELRVERRFNFAPLFQVKLLFQESGSPAMELEGLCAEPFHIELQTSAYDIVLAVLASETTMQATFEYDTDLFDREQIAAMAQDVEIIVEAIANNLDISIGQLTAILAQHDDERLREEARQAEVTSLSRLKSVRPKAIAVHV